MKSIQIMILIVFGLWGLKATALADDYRILITNDDGIHYPGLIALAENLAKDHEVIVAAPAENMSGNSHATNLFKGPVTVDELPDNGRKYRAFAVHGTPADAARFGLVQMRNQEKPVDLVISGINPGSNIGSLSHLSGTIGAAMEAQYYDIPAIAINLDRKVIKEEGFAPAIDLVRKMITEVRKNGLPKGVILNANIPHHAKGLKIVPMGGSVLDVKAFTKTEEGYEAEIISPLPEAGKVDNDSDAYENGYTTITPLQIDWTAHDMLPTLQKWHLK